LLIFVSATYAADCTEVNEITDENSDISPETNDDLIIDDSLESGEEQTDDENNELTDENYGFDEITDDYYYFDELLEEPTDIDDAIEEYIDDYLPEEFDDSLYDEYYDDYLSDEFDEDGDSEEFTDDSDYSDDGTFDASDEYLDDQFDETGYWDDLLDDPVYLDDGNILYKEITGFEPTENLYDYHIYTCLSNNVNNESNMDKNNRPLQQNNKNTWEKTNSYSTENQDNKAQGDIINQPEINSNQDNSPSDISAIITPKMTLAGYPSSSDDKDLLDLILEFITKIFYR
jgi:hypothetical protein